MQQSQSNYQKQIFKADKPGFSSYPQYLLEDIYQGKNKQKLLATERRVCWCTKVNPNSSMPWEKDGFTTGRHNEGILAFLDCNCGGTVSSWIGWDPLPVPLVHQDSQNHQHFSRNKGPAWTKVICGFSLYFKMIIFLYFINSTLKFLLLIHVKLAYFTSLVNLFFNQGK